ncbi:hypothetical protein QUB68_17805 [Microcoleus sp. A006_D1]
MIEITSGKKSFLGAIPAAQLKVAIDRPQPLASKINIQSKY